MRTVPCEKCDLKFFSIGRMRTHMTQVHPENPEESAKNRKVHERIRLENGQLRYKCDICEAVLHSNKSVHHHKEVVHGLVVSTTVLNCPFEGCDYSTKFRINLNNHTSRSHNGKRHVCEHCGEKFVGAKELRHHVTRMHVNEEHVCEDCGKVYTNPLTLSEHKKSHGEAKYVCAECGKAFVRPQHLRTHQRYTHSEVRGFICLCSKAFKSKSHLIRHWKEKGHTKGKRINAKGELEDTELNIMPDMHKRYRGKIVRAESPDFIGDDIKD